MWGSTSWAQHPLLTGTVRQQFLSGAPRDITMGVACEMDLNSSTKFIFWIENTNVQEVKLKMSCYNRDQDWSVGVYCRNTLRLVWTVRQIPRHISHGIWLLVSHMPSCIVTTNPSRISLNPLSNFMMPLVSLKWQYSIVNCGLLEYVSKGIVDYIIIERNIIE